MNEMKLEPGWLLRTCHDAHIRSMCDKSPSFFDYLEQLGFKAPKVSEGDVGELYEMMNARFAAWTGKTLREHQ